MAQDWTAHLRLFCEVNSCANDLTKIEESKRATQQNVTYVHIFFFTTLFCIGFEECGYLKRVSCDCSFCMIYTLYIKSLDTKLLFII